MPRPLRFAAVLLLAATAACSSSKHSSGSSTSGPSTSRPNTSQSSASGSSTSTAAAGACTFTPDRASPAGPHPPGIPPSDPGRTSGAETVTLTLSEGTVTFREDDAKTPCTAASFRWLAGKGFFDGTTCHRLTTQGIFVLQCGDPTGTGSGGPGYTIPDENLSGATYPAGTVAMANTGSPHTGGSQFFLVYAASPLPPQYTPFGTVTSGLDVLQGIGRAGEDDSNGPGDGHPKKAVVIRSFRVTPSP